MKIDKVWKTIGVIFDPDDTPEEISAKIEKRKIKYRKEGFTQENDDPENKYYSMFNPTTLQMIALHYDGQKDVLITIPDGEPDYTEEEQARRDDFMKRWDDVCAKLQADDPSWLEDAKQLSLNCAPRKDNGRWQYLGGIPVKAIDLIRVKIPDPEDKKKALAAILAEEKKAMDAVCAELAEQGKKEADRGAIF